MGRTKKLGCDVGDVVGGGVVGRSCGEEEKSRFDVGSGGVVGRVGGGVVVAVFLRGGVGGGGSGEKRGRDVGVGVVGVVVVVVVVVVVLGRGLWLYMNVYEDFLLLSMKGYLLVLLVLLVLWVKLLLDSSVKVWLFWGCLV